MVTDKLSSDGQYFWSVFQTRMNNLNNALVKGQEALSRNDRTSFLTHLRDACSQSHDMEACLCGLVEVEKIN